MVAREPLILDQEELMGLEVLVSEDLQEEEEALKVEEQTHKEIQAQKKVEEASMTA
jgi:uncharacterized membrane protein YgaE (UPF0421/DUF939 family)